MAYTVARLLSYFGIAFFPAPSGVVYPNARACALLELALFPLSSPLLGPTSLEVVHR